MQNPPAAGPREQLTTLAALAGNRATGQLVARLKQQDALPEHAGLDIAPLLAAQVPELLPLIPADQIKALQRDYDNDASNKELDRRHAKRRADLASGRVPGALMDSEDHDDLPGAVHGHYKPVTGPLSFELRTEDVLSDDILQEPAKNKALEMAFRTWMHDELLKHPTVHASIDLAYVAAYKNNGQTGTTNEAVIHWGSRALPHTRGKVHFKDLVENTFAKEYHDRVTDAPELQAMRREIAEILVGIDELKAEHEERIRLNGEHPVVRRVAEFLGGGNSMLVEAEFMMDVLQHPEKGTYEERQDELSTQCPDLDIWSEPKIEAAGALAMVKNQDFEIGLLAYMRAETSFERAARRYRRYENRVMKGAGIAVKWLERAKFAGKLAAGAIPGGGVLDAALMAAMYTLAQEGGQQAAEVAQGQRSGIDFAGLAKQATMDGAMAFFGGLTQGAFTRALEARIAAAEGAAAVGYAGNKLIVGTTSAAASAVYTIPANMVLQKIIYGKAHLPASADELAKMVLDEASTAVLTDAAMQGVHHTFGEGHARGAREEARPDGAKPAEGHAGPAGTAQAEPGGAGAPRAPAAENGSPATGAAKKLELVELAEGVAKSPGSAAKLIDHFGTWEATVGSVKGGAGELRLMEPSARAQALEGLVKHREAVEQEVAKFGAEPSKKAGVADAESAAELTVKGDDAGLKVAQATEHLEAAHPGWQQRLRMRVEMDGARTKSISQSIASLPKPLQESLAQYRADAGDMLSAWREARGAQTPELREAILNRISKTEFRAWAKQMLDLTPADAAALRLEHLASSDRSFAKIDPAAAPDVRFAQIKDALDHQLLASALEPELLPPVEPAGTTAGANEVPEPPAADGFTAPLKRIGSASERLEARRIVDSMEQLGSLWPGLRIPEKLDALTRISNQALAARGIPNVHVVMSKGELAAGTGAHFDFKTWSVVVDANVVRAERLDQRLTEAIGALGRHEVDHTRQWWEMARYRAGEGDDAQTIHDKTEIDVDVAIQAVEIVKRDGPLSAAARARAEEYWHSVYGDHRKARKWTLDERAELSKRRDELKAKIDNFEQLSGKELGQLLEEKGEADELFEAVDFMYKSLPEEASSFEIEGIVKAESALMEVEREFEFAEIAARHAEDVLNGVENRLLNEIAHDRHPSPELQADQARLIMRLQKLHTKVEQLRTRRAQLEAYVQGGAAP